MSLGSFFGYEGEEGTGGGIEDINPYGEILIRAKPLKIKYETTNIIVSETEVEIGRKWGGRRTYR